MYSLLLSGYRATRLATEKSKTWLESTFQVIQKTVLTMADQGLFHCTVRFEDIVPQVLFISGILYNFFFLQNDIEFLCSFYVRA
jgi:hypothetical protein